MDGFCYLLSGIFCLGGGFNETGDALRLLLTAACNGCARCACCHHRCCWVPNGRQRRSACLENCWRFSRSRPIWAVLKTPLVSDWFLVNIGVLLAEPMKNGSAQFVAGIYSYKQSSRTSSNMVLDHFSICSLGTKDPAHVLIARNVIAFAGQKHSWEIRLSLNFGPPKSLGLSWYHHFLVGGDWNIFPPIIYSTG